jgi:hypothetical protein
MTGFFCCYFIVFLTAESASFELFKEYLPQLINFAPLYEISCCVICLFFIGGLSINQ